MPGQSIKLLQIVIRGVAQEQNKISLLNLFKFGILGGASVLSLIVWGNLGGGTNSRRGFAYSLHYLAW